MSTYNYLISADTANGVVIPSKLEREIQGSAIVTSLASITTGSNSLDITFNAALSAGDKTILDGIVAAHDGFPTAADPQEVVTQYEKNDKSLKMAKGKASTVNGVAEIYLECPGTFGSGSGRAVWKGFGWFENPRHDDYIKVWMVDVDNEFGFGPGTVVGGYTETGMGANAEGAYICKHQGFVEVHTVGGFGDWPSGLHMLIQAFSEGQAADTFRVRMDLAEYDGS